MSYPDSIIYELSEEGIQEKKLEETNHFQIMKQFLNDPKRMLHHLLE
jgi:predicted ATPase